MLVVTSFPYPIILDHAPSAIFQYLELADALRLRTTCRAARAVVADTWTTVDAPFRSAEHMDRFLRAVLARPLQHVAFRSNALRATRGVEASRLLSLTLARCNLTPARLAEVGLPAWLEGATRLRELNVAENPLTAEGARTVLSALRSRDLERLSLAGCGIRRLFADSVSETYVGRVVSLDLGDNRLLRDVDVVAADVAADGGEWATVRAFLRPFRSLRVVILERILVPLDEFAADHPHVASVVDVSWRDFEELWAALRGRPQVRSVTMRCVRSAARLTRAVVDPVLGQSQLECLGLISTQLLPSEWSVLLGSFARHCRPRALTLWGTNVPVTALLTFFRKLREPAAFVALSVWRVDDMDTPAFRTLCTAMHEAGVRLQYFTLQDCDQVSFRGAEDGARLASVMDARRAVKLDLKRARASAVDDAADEEDAADARAFLARALEGMPTLRKVVLGGWPAPAPAPAPSFRLPCPRVEYLDVSNAPRRRQRSACEWLPPLDDPGGAGALSRLRYMDMRGMTHGGGAADTADDAADTDDDASALLARALASPRLETLVASLNVLEAPVTVPTCRYLEVLNLDGCRLGRAFRASLLAALGRGCFPVLAMLTVYSTAAYHHDFTVGLVQALKGGQRGCRLNARGRAWDTECRLQYLHESLRGVGPDALSALCITASVYLAGVVMDIQRERGGNGGTELIVSYM